MSGRGAVWFSALAWGARGRWFESSRPDQKNVRHTSQKLLLHRKRVDALYGTVAGTDLGRLVDIFWPGLQPQRRDEPRGSFTSRRIARLGLPGERGDCVATGGYWRDCTDVRGPVCIHCVSRDGTQQGLSNLDDHFRATYYGVASFSSRVSFSRKLAEIVNIRNLSKQLIT